MGIFSFFQKRKGDAAKQAAANDAVELEARYEEELAPVVESPDASQAPEPEPLSPEEAAAMFAQQAPRAAPVAQAAPVAPTSTPPSAPKPTPSSTSAPKPTPTPEAPVKASFAELDEPGDPLLRAGTLPDKERSAIAAEGKKKGLFGRLKTAVAKTRMVLSRRVAGIIGLGQKINEDLLEELEDALIEADLGVNTTDLLMEDIRKAWKAGDIETGDDIFPFLKADLKHRLAAKPNTVRQAAIGPTVILVVGVNGAGKTTSIAKIARVFVNDGRKVLLAAGDTFRAAAVEQLVTWSGRIGCDIVTERQGIDPASVAFKACERGRAEAYDVVIIDTAGRLHTQKDLMEELSKIHRVIRKQIPEAPHETILVLDATTGQNAIQQAKMFGAVAEVTGIFLAKLDGTAKGGAVLSIDRETGIPVKFVGVGESFDDVQRFSPHAFVDALFDLGAEVASASSTTA